MGKEAGQGMGDADQRRVLVIGATGALGAHLLDELVARGVRPGRVTAAGRNAARLGELARTGFTTAALDLADTQAIADVVCGHCEVVLISGGDPDRAAQHRAVIDAAVRAGVGHFYYTSAVRADDTRVAINADHAATEQALAASGLRYTVLRNTWYIENYAQLFDGPRHTGVLAAAVGDAVVAAASRRDLAEALAVVITTQGHEGATYSLSGDTDFTYDDIAQAIASVLGREVRYQALTPEQLRHQLIGAGLGEDLTAFLVGLDRDIATGTFARVGDDLTRLIGRPSTPLVPALLAELARSSKAAT